MAIGLGLPAQAQEREWILDVADEDAYLAFGVPETDDVGMSFWCKIGSGKLRLFLPDGSPDLAPGTTAEFNVRVAEKDFALKGQTMANDMSGHTSVEAELGTGDALVKELMAADRFMVTVQKHVMTFPLADANLQDLLKLCEVKQP
ncbi:MAG: hypothetical protein LCH46_13560 [Proteobacteria bacterium]|nr:hypothetical protein [Pseudomonadota bacterium]